MRVIAGICCLSAALAAAPAFAQIAPSTSTSLSKATDQGVDSTAKGNGFNFGFIDRLTVNKTAETPTAGLAPIEKDQIELNWRPGGKWGLSLDLTNRAENQLLPREEFAAGAYYQVTPRFRFGGGVTLKGDSLSSPEAWKQQPADAGVHIESAFSF